GKTFKAVFEAGLRLKRRIFPSTLRIAAAATIEDRWILTEGVSCMASGVVNRLLIFLPLPDFVWLSSLALRRLGGARFSSGMVPGGSQSWTTRLSTPNCSV